MNIDQISNLFELNKITKFEIREKKNYSINFKSSENLIKKISELINEINKNEKIYFENKINKNFSKTEINNVFEKIKKNALKKNESNKTIEKKLIIKIKNFSENEKNNLLKKKKLFENFPFLNSNPKKNLLELKEIKKVIEKKICEYYSEKYLKENLKDEEKISFGKFVKILKNDLEENFENKKEKNFFDFQKKYFGKKNILENFQNEISIILKNPKMKITDIIKKLKNEKKILQDFFLSTENSNNLKEKINDLKKKFLDEKTKMENENTSLILKDSIMKNNFLPFEKIKEEFEKKNLNSNSSRFIDNTINYDFSEKEKFSLNSNFKRSLSLDKNISNFNNDNKIKIFEILENEKKKNKILEEKIKIGDSKITFFTERIKNVINYDFINFEEITNLKIKIKKLSKKIRKFTRSKKTCKNCKKIQNKLQTAENAQKQLNKKNSKLLEELMILDSKQKKFKIIKRESLINAEDLAQLQIEKNDLQIKNQILSQKVEFLNKNEEDFYEEISKKSENSEKLTNNNNKLLKKDEKKKIGNIKENFPMINNEYYSFGRNLKMSKTLEAVSEEERSSFHQSQESSLNYRGSYHDFLEKRKKTSKKKKSNFVFKTNFKFNYNWPGIFHFMKQENFKQRKKSVISKSKKNIFDKDKILKNILDYQKSESQLKNSKLSLPNLSFNEEKINRNKLVKLTKKEVLETMLKKKLKKIFKKFVNLQNQIKIKENRVFVIKNNLENFYEFLKQKKNFEMNLEISEKTFKKNLNCEEENKIKENEEIFELKEENEDLREMVMNVFERLVPLVEDEIEDIEEVVPNRNCLMQVIDILENKVFERNVENEEDMKNEGNEENMENEEDLENKQNIENEEYVDDIEFSENKENMENMENKVNEEDIEFNENNLNDQFSQFSGDTENKENNEKVEVEFSENSQNNKYREEKKNLLIEEFDEFEKNRENSSNEENKSYKKNSKIKNGNFKQEKKNSFENEQNLFDEDDIIENDDFIEDSNLLEQDIDDHSDIHDFEEISKNKNKKYSKDSENKEFVENLENEKLINLGNYKMIKKVFDNLGEKIFGLISKNKKSIKNIKKKISSQKKEKIQQELQNAKSSINSIKELMEFVHKNLKNFFTEFDVESNKSLNSKNENNLKKESYKKTSFENMCFLLNTHANIFTENIKDKNFITKNLSRNNSAPGLKIEKKKINKFDMRKNIENFLIINDIGIPNKLIVRAGDTEELDLLDKISEDDVSKSYDFKNNDQNNSFSENEKDNLKNNSFSNNKKNYDDENNLENENNLEINSFSENENKNDEFDNNSFSDKKNNDEYENINYLEKEKASEKEITFQSFYEKIKTYINFFKKTEKTKKNEKILSKLTKIIQIFEENLHHTQKKPKKHNKKIEILKNTLINKENSIIFLKDRISMLEQTLDLRTNQLSEIKKKQNDKISENFKTKNSKTVKNLKTKLKEYTKKIKNLKEIKKNFEFENEKLQNHFSEIIKKYKYLEKEYKNLQKINENFEEEQKKNFKMSKIIKELQNTIEEYKNEYIKFQKKSHKKILKLKKNISKLKISNKEIKNYYTDDNITRLSMKKKADFILLENNLRQKDLYISNLLVRIKELKNFNQGFGNRSNYEVRVGGKKSNNVSYLD